MVLDNRAAILKSGLKIYIEVGDLDMFHLDEGTEYLHRVMWDHGIPHEYRLVENGDHTGATINPRMRAALRFLDRAGAGAAGAGRGAAAEQGQHRQHAPRRRRARRPAAAALPLDGPAEMSRTLIGRRSLLAAAPALALARPALAASKDIAVRGSKDYSESAMVMSVSTDGRSALTLRFCRFPVEGFTWLWCHVLHDGELYAFTSHDLPATSDRLAGTPVADYRAPPMDAALTRTGRGPELTGVRLSAALPFHKSRAAPHGPGKSPGRFEGRFHPTSALTAQVLAGRDEVYGTFHAEGTIGGHRFVHDARPSSTSSARRPPASRPR